jgi:NitT/TauT family transport system permease protein
VPFLQRGLLPLGNFVSALPIIGIAPIMVMWFGFDWQSKAAVVVIMTFFPMLVNTVAGLHAPAAMERDLMRTYAAATADAGASSGCRRAAVHLQRPQDQLDARADRRHRGRILRHADRRHGLPHLDRGRPHGVDMVWAKSPSRRSPGPLFYGAGARERATTFWHPSFGQ